MSDETKRRFLGNIATDAERLSRISLYSRQQRRKIYRQKI